MKVMPSPRRPARDVGVAHPLPDRREGDEWRGAQPMPEPKSEDGALGEGVLALHHEQRASEDRAVDRDQRQEDAERRVELGATSVERHLDDLDHRGDRPDVGQEAEERQVVTPQAAG